MYYVARILEVMNQNLPIDNSVSKIPWKVQFFRFLVQSASVFLLAPPGALVFILVYNIPSATPLFQILKCLKDPSTLFSHFKCCIKYPKWSNWAISEHQKGLWILTKNEIVLYPMHGALPAADIMKIRLLFEVEHIFIWGHLLAHSWSRCMMAERSQNVT